MNLTTPTDHAGHLRANHIRVCSAKRMVGGQGMSQNKSESKPLPSQEDINALMSYDAGSGKLFWKERPEKFFKEGQRKKNVCSRWNNMWAGKEAFTSTNISGYKQGTFLGSVYRAHRIIWKMQTGEEPVFIDHIDGDRTNNRIENLRSVSAVDNSKNISIGTRNTSGVTGVSKTKSGKMWRAFISANEKQIHIGTFRSKSDAAIARKSAEVALGFHQNHGKKNERLSKS